MAERTGYWGGPDRWAEPVHDADPTSGRHAFDQDAALTPIFTTLRRTAHRSHLRSVPAEPLTAPIPVVPPLPAYPDVPSPTETTTWWRSPVGFPPVPAHEEALALRPRPAADDRGLPAPHPAPAYAGYDEVGWDDGYHGGHEAYPHDAYPHDAYGGSGGYAPAAPRAAMPAERAAYPAPHPAPYPAPYPVAHPAPAPVRYDRRFDRHVPHPDEYDPLADTGRHHLRLAPAGW